MAIEDVGFIGTITQLRLNIGRNFIIEGGYLVERWVRGRAAQIRFCFAIFVFYFTFFAKYVSKFQF